MVVADLRTLLKKYEEDELRQIIVELYKSMPKQLKEDKDIDLMLEDYTSYANISKLKKTKVEKVDVNKLKPQIDLFVEYAYNSYYFAPNNYVHKKDRPKWRFKVKAFIKDLQTVPYEGEEGKIATKLLIDLYDMLCYGSTYYIFSTEDPFNSVGIEQDSLLDNIIKRIFSNSITEASVKAAINAAVGNKGGSFCTYVIFDNLKTPDAKEIAIEQGKLVKCEAENIKNVKKEFYNDYIYNDRINALVTFVTRLHLDLCEYKEAISYFNANQREGSKEVGLFVLLNIIESFELVDIWLSTYNDAVSKKVKPRDSLVKMYNYISENKKFPEHYIY